MKFTCSIDITDEEYNEFKRLEMLLNDENLCNLRLKDLGNVIQQETRDLAKTRRFLIWFVLCGLQFSWLTDAMMKEP
jgi:hypothetical protein